MRTSFIGGGVMAEAMISRSIEQGVLAVGDVCIGEPVAGRREQLARRYSVATTAENRDAINGAKLIVLSVKPQQLPDVLQEVGGWLSPDQTVVSIVAGATIAALTGGLDHARVVRVMPNTPARVGAGISVWTAAEAVEPEARQAVAQLLEALGTQVYVSEEAYLDMATAVSGSGPAYVFAFMEALTDASVQLGIPREMAQALVLETVLGSATLAKETGERPSSLRESVTSPGGTTAEALLELERHGLRTAIMEAVLAAHRKALALGAPEGQAAT